MSGRSLTPSKQFVNYIMTRTSFIRRDNDDIRLVPDQHALLNLHSASSLFKKQCTERHFAPLGHTILILSHTCLLLLLLRNEEIVFDPRSGRYAACMSREATNANFTRPRIEHIIYRTRSCQTEDRTHNLPHTILSDRGSNT